MNKDYVEMFLNLHPITVVKVYSKVSLLQWLISYIKTVNCFSLQMNCVISQKRFLFVLEFLTCQFFKKKDITEYIISEKISLPKLAIQLQCAANMFHDCSTIIQGVSGVSLIFWEWHI